MNVKNDLGFVEWRDKSKTWIGKFNPIWRFTHLKFAKENEAYAQCNIASFTAKKEFRYVLHALHISSSNIPSFPPPPPPLNDPNISQQTYFGYLGCTVLLSYYPSYSDTPNIKLKSWRISKRSSAYQNCVGPHNGSSDAKKASKCNIFSAHNYTGCIYILHTIIQGVYIFCTQLYRVYI